MERKAIVFQFKLFFKEEDTIREFKIQRRDSNENVA